MMKKVVVVCDAHIFVTTAGVHWCTSIYGYSFFQRFMNVFDEVHVVARSKRQELPQDGKYLVVDGPRLTFHPVYFFQGPGQLFKHLPAVLKSLEGFVPNDADAVVYRMPSTTAQLAFLKRPKGKGEKPSAIEVVYNYGDELKDSMLSKRRKLISLANDRFLKWACAHKDTNGVSYVTENILQDRYPSYARLHCLTNEHFESYYSTIQFKFRSNIAPKCFAGKKKWTISNVCVHIQNEARGHRTMIESLAILRERGVDIEIIFVGDGPYISVFRKLASELNVEEYVHFAGLLPSSDDVFNVLCDSDLFVYPTHFAGLPRVLIEAMGAGLPCVSSPVAGIPEIVLKSNLVKPDDPAALAALILKMISDPEKLADESRRNIDVARQYDNALLQERRDVFYGKLANLA